MATLQNSRSELERQKKELILKSLPSLKSFAISLTRDQTRAEDLVQQTILQALSNLERFKSGTNMQAWLFTILRNHFRSVFRKMKREQEWDPRFEDAMFFSTGATDSEAESTHDFQRLLLCLACLPNDQSDALVAIGYLRMKYDEAAECLGCQLGTVKSRVNRARLELAALIDGSRIKNVDLTKLKTATNSVPRSHKYYPIAKAYEELYANLQGVDDSQEAHAVEETVSKKADTLWEGLVASGALDQENETFSDFIQNNSSDS